MPKRWKIDGRWQTAAEAGARVSRGRRAAVWLLEATRPLGIVTGLAWSLAFLYEAGFGVEWFLLGAIVPAILIAVPVGVMQVVAGELRCGAPPHTHGAPRF